MILLLGRFPSNTFDLTNASEAFGPSSYPSYVNYPKQIKHIPQLRPYLSDFLLSLPKRQRLRLSKEVAKENPVMFRMANGVVRCSGGEEIRRNQFCPLVDELVK